MVFVYHSLFCRKITHFKIEKKIVNFGTLQMWYQNSIHKFEEIRVPLDIVSSIRITLLFTVKAIMRKNSFWKMSNKSWRWPLFLRHDFNRLGPGLFNGDINSARFFLLCRKIFFLNFFLSTLAHCRCAIPILTSFLNRSG